MTDHPITPPPELVKQWMAEIWHEGTPVRVAASDLHIATQAAHWGANQELDACCEWLDTGPYGFSIEATAPCMIKRLRAARRPKPPSLKEQALAALNEAVYMADDSPPEGISTDQADIIRRALEALPND